MWLSFWASGIPSYDISPVAILQPRSALHQHSLLRFPLDWSEVRWKVLNSMTGHVIIWVALLYLLRDLHITSPDSKQDFIDELQRQCYPLLATGAKNHPEQVMITHALFGSNLMCDLAKGGPIGSSRFRPLNYIGNQSINFEHLEDTNNDVLYTCGDHPILNLFWQYPLCNVYLLWQPDKLHQLLLGIAKNW